MWYHYAFMAISVAMFGMTAGAVTVYLSRWITLDADALYRRIAMSSLFFSIATVFSLFTLLSIPFVPRQTGVGIFSMGLTYLVAAVPFYFSGIVISAILSTRFIAMVSGLYAADLAGAAGGALLFFFFLRVTDAVSFIVFLAALPALASFFLSRRLVPLIFCVLFVLLAVINHDSRWFRIEWQKVETGYMSVSVDTQTEWEGWTPFSRVTVTPYLDSAFGWGISPRFSEEFPSYRVGQKNLVIDAAAATIITMREKPVEELHHLRYDITNLAHFLVRNARVAVIGVGGGRDILSALHFGQREVWGIEINEKILEALTKTYGDVTYPFEEMPQVHLVHDEARSFLERTDQRFDIIQASLIDSWAATTSGAFVLTENSLYTVEGWKVFLSRLTERGVVTMSRWYYRKRPGEMLRLASLAYEALIASGVEHPSAHIMVAATVFSGGGAAEDDTEKKRKQEEEVYGTGTIIVSKHPFDGDAVHTFLTTCDRYQFDVLLAAGYEGKSVFQHIVSDDKRKAMIDAYPLDLTAPTDDSPFFFNMLKPSALFTYRGIEKEGPLNTNLCAVRNLFVLLGIVVVLAILLIVVPLLMAMEEKRVSLLFHPWTFYFAAIGLGFMLIEIALIQRFTVFLGHPTYSLLVVFCTILLFTGFGSWLTGRLRGRFTPLSLFILLIAIVTLAGGATIYILPHLSGAPLAGRILYSAGVMAAVGTVLGMPFPTGMTLLTGEQKTWAPWLWGINGAFGVVSSVLATALSLFFGISVTFSVGVGAYFLALAALVTAQKEGNR